MGKVKAATLTLKQLSKLGRTQKNKRPNDIAIRTSRDETGARPMRYFDRDSPHVIKRTTDKRYIANVVEEPRTHVSVGKQKVPIEHTEIQKHPGGKGSRRIFKKEYAPLYTQFHARQSVDIPVIQDLYSKYGNPEFMGRPFTRLNNKIIQRIVNRERAKKNYGPLSVATQPSGTLAGTIKAAVPDFPSRMHLNKYPLTKGRIKKEIEIENYLKEIDPVTKQPRYLSTHTRDLAKDPRFSIGTPRATEEVIRRIRREHNPPLEKTISRYGTPMGTDISAVSVSPTGRLRQAVDHFTKSTTRGTQDFDLIKSRRKKREQQLNNIVLGNLSPELKKTAEGLLKHGRTFMQALHETFSMHRSPEMAKALSTWVRNMKHTTAEHNVRKLRKMRKEVNDPDRRWDIDFELAGWDDDMAAIGVQSNIDGVIYGKWYDQNKSFVRPLVEDLPREYPLKQMKFLNPETKKMEKTKFKGMNEGGIVNGYSKGGKVMKLLDDAIGMMSRRKFLKGTGATALSTALPKSALQLAPAALKKGALNFAPPWVNGMLSSLKNVKDLGALGQRRSVIGGGMSIGNDSKIINLGTKNIKVYKDQKGTVTYYKIKPRDEKVADDIARSKGEKTEDYWDDVELREEPGQTTITWKNKEYDGNDQHVVIDKLNKETRFVDDNWSMEAGGGDIVKDDWIEWAITPNKSKTAKSLKKTVDEIDDAILDGDSVNDMDNHYADMFRSYVDSFSPSGNIFGTTERMVKKITKRDALRKEKLYNDQEVRNLEEKNMMDWEDQFRGGKGIHAYDRGGIARRPNAVPPTSGPDPYATFIEDSVSQIRNNPSEYMGSKFIQKFNKGGFVKKNAPKILGKLTNYRPKLTMSDVLKNIQKEKKGKTKTTLKSMEPKVEQPGAMFWGSREKIIGAPSESMTGTQWLQYMKIGKHGILNPKGYPRIKDMELNDTSLAPWLSRMGTKTVSKESLVKQFDEMAPTMDVTVLGETTGTRIIGDLSRKLKEVDTQAIRNPAIKGFFDYVKAVMPQLKDSTTDDAAKGIVKGIDDMVFNNFGVKDALTEGVPQRFPFEIKEVLQQLSTALGRRTAGFKTYTRSPEHRGTQTMAGGDNYREFLFKAKPGSLRQNEPSYQYAHSFNLSSADRAGGVVHARTSDRADQFGRRLLHIEEIQSDMHQKVNAAQRALKKKHAIWEKDGLTPEKGYSRLTKNDKKDYDKLVASSKYAPRGDLKEEIGTANEQHFALVKSKIEDLLSQPQTKQTVTRLTKLKKERTKIRKMIEEEKAKMAEGIHSGIPQGPLSKTEDYNEFIMKYMLKVAREGGYDGITINTPAIKNLNMSSTGRDYKGNLIAYGPMAQGAMKKAAKKSGAKFMKTYIVDDDNRVWEVPMILIKENKAAQALIDKGLPIYKKGGIVKK